LPTAAVCVWPDAHVLEDVALEVEHEERLVARAPVDARLRLGIAGEVADGDGVHVIAELAVVAPEAPALVVPHRVADEELVAAVAVGVEGEREVAGVVLA
jgi:hypothetical protein